MTTGISRRAMLRAVALAAAVPQYLLAAQPAATTKAPAKGPAKAPAAAAPPPPKNICLQMLYPTGEGLTFDADAFRDRHIPVLLKAYAGGLERIELRVSPPLVEGAKPAPLLAAVSMWISDFSKFVAGANANAKEVAASMATITKSAPIAQFDSVTAGLGGARASVLANTKCMTFLFEAKKDVTWDRKGFAEAYLPRLVAAYGPEAIRRVEITEGVQSANGSDPLLLGLVNFYIADPDKFLDATATEAVKALAPEEAKYYSTPPIQILMQVHSIG